MQQLDRLHESLRGSAAGFAGLQAEIIRADYVKLCVELRQCFKHKEPAVTAQRKLIQLKQGRDTAKEFAEQVHRLVTQAYLVTSLASMQEELAAEAFLQGYHNARVAYQAMKSGLKTLVDAQELVEAYEHNYKATLGHEADGATRHRARPVTWASNGEKTSYEVGRISTPVYTTLKQVASTMEKHMTQQLEKQTDVLRNLLAHKKDQPTSNGQRAMDNQGTRPPSPHPRGRSPGQCFCLQRDRALPGRLLTL